MITLLNGIARAAVATIVLPLDAAVDAVTLGGALTDSESKVVKRGKQIFDAIDDAVEQDG